MKRSTNTVTTVNTTHTVELNRADLLDILKDRFQLERSDHVSITVRVPGGGDWSNTTLSVGDDVPLVLHIARTTSDATESP